MDSSDFSIAGGLPLNLSDVSEEGVVKRNKINYTNVNLDLEGKDAILDYLKSKQLSIKSELGKTIRLVCSKKACDLVVMIECIGDSWFCKGSGDIAQHSHQVSNNRQGVKLDITEDAWKTAINLRNAGQKPKQIYTYLSTNNSISGITHSQLKDKLNKYKPEEKDDGGGCML
uniref:DBD_Tnp_Mut domain-containing protein n=1 Tax=Rhabditophanes sp. KR3021 TaxID=114890 RepID=A0AC35TS88_9BILA